MNISTDIYKLTLHETMSIDSEWQILRVPGGWIYSFTSVNAHNTGEPNNAYYTHDVRHIFVPITQQSKEEQMEGLLAI